MAINKVIYDSNTLLDLSQDTVTSEKLLSGYTAHDRSGNLITGVASGETTTIGDMEEFIENYDEENGFILSYDHATNGKTYVTNSVTTSKGIYEETSDVSAASTWYFEQVSGYTDRYYVYTEISGTKYYMYNNTSSNANFMGLSETTKAIFIISLAENRKFYFKISTSNRWLQHSNSGGGIRLYTDNNTAANSQFTLTYKVNAIVPYGTLTITENGNYDVSKYANIIVNIE